MIRACSKKAVCRTRFAIPAVTGALAIALVVPQTGLGQDRVADRGDTACPFTCGDIDGAGGVDLIDFAQFAACYGLSPALSVECACSDLNADGGIDLVDFATFAALFGISTTHVPPDCLREPLPDADLTAYRPQTRGCRHTYPKPEIRTYAPRTDR